MEARPAAGKIREQVGRILRQSEFAANPRTCAFLSHVTERALEGRGEEVKEATIGVEVFGRAPGYDARADSIVRTEARRLREKLADYYLTEGREDAVRIAIPKGTYVPEFKIVKEIVKEEAAKPSRVRQALGAAAALAVIGAIGGPWAWNGLTARHAERMPTLAVLPFANQNGASYLSDGLTEDLERDLSRVRGLRLHARSPAEALRDRTRLDYRELSGRLRVDALLDGSVAVGEKSTEINVKLVRGSDSSVLWTDHFESANASAAEQRIEEGVSRAMGLKPAPRARVENPKAHDLFLAGRALWATRDAKKIQEAIGLFEQAITVDPNDALAYMGIADAYGLMTMNVQIGAAEGIANGEKAAVKALELDPELAEAHAAMGMLKVAQWDWKTADREYRQAIELNPSYDRAYVRAGVVRFYLGDFPAAERLIREAETLNPYALSLPLIRAEVYYYSRRYADEEALIREVQRAEPKDTAEYALTLAMLAPCLEQERRLDEAIEAARAAAAADPSFTMNLAETLHAAGRNQESAAALPEALRANANNPYRLAIAFARLGDREKAIEYLRAALEARVPDLPSVRWEPAFDWIREDGRYKAIVAKIFPSRS